jgi:hypothetical protein
MLRQIYRVPLPRRETVCAGEERRVLRRRHFVEIHEEDGQPDLMLGALIFEGLSPVEAHRKHPFRNLDHRSFGSGRLLDRSIFSQEFKLGFGGVIN